MLAHLWGRRRQSARAGTAPPAPPGTTRDSQRRLPSSRAFCRDASSAATPRAPVGSWRFLGRGRRAALEDLGVSETKGLEPVVGAVCLRLHTLVTVSASELL